MPSTLETWKNPEIDQARQVALSILKPTAAQLEHGLELHRQSLVIDSYGFSASAAPGLDFLRTMQQQKASQAELKRLYTQSMMTRMADDPRQRELYIEAWRAAGVTCVLRNSGEEGNHMPRMLERLAYNTYVTDQLDELMIRATTPGDIRRAREAGKVCFYYTTNGVPLPGDCIDAHMEMRQIRLFFMLGVRMMHLTYNRRNVIGDGCAEPKDAGLSEFGRDVVREMNRLGVIVDGAHSSQQTCRDMAAVSNKPVVVSHSSCNAVNQHIRGKADDVIKAVADTGGFMGIACVPAFLGGSGDIAAFLDHVMHAVKLVGHQHVAIGTDASIILPNDSDGEFHLPPSRRLFDSHWPENDPLFDKRWAQPAMRLSMIWTNFPMFTVGLVQRGLSDEQIQAILGGNVLRVAEAALER